MGWNFDKPLYSLSDDKDQAEMLKLWEAEKHGGLWMGNNRLPFPFTFLMALIILTAFMITMPIWGQRPKADNFQEHVKLLDSAEIQALTTPEEKMKRINQIAFEKADGRTKAQLERHPLTYDDLLNIAPAIRELQTSAKYPLGYYNVLGDTVALANHEGNYRDDGKRERVQPWWDKGYTIDVFYVSYFIIVMVLVIKRLPHFSRKPNMKKKAA